jgi:hypothetical protein
VAYEYADAMMEARNGNQWNYWRQFNQQNAE